MVRLGPPPVEPDAMQRLFCTCAPVHDYTGREVARVGVFGHGPDDGPIVTEHHKGRVGHGAPHFDPAGARPASDPGNRKLTSEAARTAGQEPSAPLR